VTRPGEPYEFVFRALLTEQALDSAGRRGRHSGLFDHDLEAAVSLDLLNEHFVANARQMAVVYTAVAAFENMVRDLVSGVLLEAYGENWWQARVSERVRRRAEGRREDEQKHRFHKQRGEAPIYYSEFGDLINIIRANWSDFEAFFPTPEWAASIVEAVERSRNVIMHSGTLDAEDVARVGIHIRDWIKQVGA
jgi:hypothetical protein